MDNTPSPCILITGISSGIGLFLAKNLSNTYPIIGTVRKEYQKLELEAEIPNLSVYLMEMKEPDSIRSAFEQIILDHPKLKIKALINNAGYAVPGPLVELETKLLEEQLRVNLIAPIELVQLSLPFLMKGQSRIINISSVSGLFASPFLGAYCASKYGLEAISDSLRRELALIGIKVILIEPGSLKTDIWTKHFGLKSKFPHSKFSNFLESADELIEKIEAKAIPVDCILKPILHAIENNRPRNRYLVHKSPFLFKLFAHFIPSRWVDFVIHRQLSKKNIRPF